jgi:hypothetical protein
MIEKQAEVGLCSVLDPDPVTGIDQIVISWEELVFLIGIQWIGLKVYRCKDPVHGQVRINNSYLGSPIKNPARFL